MNTPKSPPKSPPVSTPEIPSGTLDLLILHTVADSPRHGYAIARRIKERSNGTLLVEEGSLYPALHRLVRRKQLAATWGVSENNRRARFYKITSAGKKRLKVDAQNWQRAASAVASVLGGAKLGGAKLGDVSRQLVPAVAQ